MFILDITHHETRNVYFIHYPMPFQLDHLAQDIKENLGTIIVTIDHPIPAVKLKAQVIQSKTETRLYAPGAWIT